jgi:hypothetical protein
MRQLSCPANRIVPAAPTAAHPGSPEKIAVLRERAALGMPLFVAGDAEGARQLQTGEPGVKPRARLAGRLLAALSQGEEVPSYLLVERLGYSAGHVGAELRALAAAGLAVPGKKRGWWRLSEV